MRQLNQVNVHESCGDLSLLVKLLQAALLCRAPALAVYHLLIDTRSLGHQGYKGLVPK